MSRGSDPLLGVFLAEHDAACRACGYSLRRCEDVRCPECGREIDLAELLAPRAPTPKNDLLVLSIVGLCGALVATLLGGTTLVGAVLGPAAPYTGLLVIGMLAGEGALLVLWIRRPRRFTNLARPVQWMVGLSLGGPTLAVIAGIVALITWAIANI